MIDRLYLPLLGLLAAAAVGFAMIWPQGLGDRSPPPFGHTPIQQTPAMKAAMQRETETSERHIREKRDAVRNLQTQALSPQ